MGEALGKCKRGNIIAKALLTKTSFDPYPTARHSVGNKHKMEEGRYQNMNIGAGRRLERVLIQKELR